MTSIHQAAARTPRTPPMDLIQSGRESISQLERPQQQVRVLHALSRYTDTPAKLFVELTDHGYEAREEGGVSSAAAEAVILQAAPASEAEALPVPDLIAGSDIKRTTAHAVAKKLVSDGKLRETGQGVRGDPHRYWRAEIHSSGTPSP